MLLTLSSALLFAAVTLALVWSRRIGGFAALVVWLSGFTAATTFVAGPVRAFLTAFGHALH